MLSESALLKIWKTIDFLEDPLSGLLTTSHLSDVVTWPSLLQGQLVK